MSLRRREFVAALGGAAAAWPLAARPQQGDRVRRIDVLIRGDENDPEVKRRLSAFTQALAGLGWADGHMRMDLRFGGGDIKRIGTHAQELVGLQPDIILANGATATAAVQRASPTIPIVFATVGDPVASGLSP
jgi:putative ABC transport system substrate-binding protein